MNTAMKNKQDYYHVLGVQRSVGVAELKSAYRKLGKKYHPDTNPDKANADAKMKEINEAYDVLSDPKKRAEYDRNGQTVPGQRGTGKKGGVVYGGFGSADSINFDDIFTGAFGDHFAGVKGKNDPKRGRDVSVNIQIEPGEVMSGVEKEVAFGYSETCEACGGTGSTAETAVESCKQCGGSGKERVTTQSAFGKMVQTRACSLCHGRGKDAKGFCLNCSGDGVRKVNKRVLVKIPKGIKNGQSITIAGMGEPGENGGLRGNLLIKVSVRLSYGF